MPAARPHLAVGRGDDAPPRRGRVLRGRALLVALRLPPEGRGLQPVVQRRQKEQREGAPDAVGVNPRKGAGRRPRDLRAAAGLSR